jgi:hypothetical protein
MFAIQAFIHPRSLPGECEYSSSKNGALHMGSKSRVPSNGPQNTKLQFYQKSSNDFDLIYGDYVPKLNYRGAVFRKISVRALGGPNSKYLIFHLLSRWFLAYLIFSTLRMEAIYPSETSIDTQRTTRRYIPEDDTLHNHRCENLESYIPETSFTGHSEYIVTQYSANQQWFTKQQLISFPR